jgi:hypothetical protein
MPEVAADRGGAGGAIARLPGLILGNDEQQRPVISTSNKRIQQALQLFG